MHFVVKEKEEFFDQDQLQPVAIPHSLKTEEDGLDRGGDVSQCCLPDGAWVVIVIVMAIGKQYFWDYDSKNEYKSELKEVLCKEIHQVLSILFVNFNSFKL